ncbi:MAG: hypothetical protein HDR09_13635 [Lachnospiraceae bacterium]|nr:hypothetical protein [Lachnospiraceae bacterium]
MQIRAKANENQIINTAGAARERAAQRDGKQFGKNGRKSIFAGDIGVQQDSITLRRQRAQKKALKIVSDAWNGDRKIDQNMMEVRDRAAQLNAEKKENLDIIAEGEAKKEALRQQYGVSADSQEQKELELLQRAEDAKYEHKDYLLTEDEWKQVNELKKRQLSEEDQELLRKKALSEDPATGVQLTDEEKEKVAQLEARENRLTEYQERCLAIDKFQRTYETRNQQIDEELTGCYATIRATRLERLKYHGMVDAQKQADEVMEAAGKEILGMMIEEAKEHVDEELEEPREEAKEKAEEKAEEEEKIAERNEKKEELEAQIDAAHERSEEQEELRREAEERSREDAELLETMIDAGVGNVGNVSDIQSEIKTMLHKMKLLEEDLKGSAVDDQL